MTEEGATRQVVGEMDRGRADMVDQVTLARIARARGDALRRLDETRDVEAWMVTVARLDAEEASARASSGQVRVLDEDEIRGCLANLGGLWRTADDESRHVMAVAMFDGLASTRFQSITYSWSAAANAYRLDQLVPAMIEVDLESLGLTGAPRGKLTVRADGHEPELEVRKAVG